MRTIQEFLVEKGILPTKGARPPYARLSEENQYLIEPLDDACKHCYTLGFVPGHIQERYVQEVLVLLGSCVVAVAESKPLDISRGLLAQAAHSVQDEIERELKIVPGTPWSLRKGFVAVTHLVYPDVTAAKCWNEIFLKALDGSYGDSPVLDAAISLAFNRDSELNKFLFPK